MTLQPFEAYDVDVESLERCGGNLIEHAAEGLTNGKLTKRAYEPAVDSVRGDCSPLIDAAERRVLTDAEDVVARLAWAAIVSRFWGSRVRGFNTRVEEIKERAWEDIAADDDDHDGEKREIRREARRDWWCAHESYVEDGRTQARAMLRDGPTPAHLRAAIEVGVMPPMSFDPSVEDAWEGFKGIVIPPDGDAVDQGLWAGKGVALAVLWYGHGVDRFARYRYRPLPPLSPGGVYLSPLSRGYPSFRFSDWTRRYSGVFDPNNWQQRYVADRYRWTRGTLPPFRRTYTPETRWGTVARYADKGFYGLDLAAGTYDQWSRDANRDDLSTGEKSARAVTRGTFETAGTYVGIEAGAKFGLMVGSWTGTPMGAVAGSIIGGVIGGVAGSTWGEEVADHAVEGASTAWNVAADGIEHLDESLGETDDVVLDAIGDKLTFW